jgi:hypothetical protein
VAGEYGPIGEGSFGLRTVSWLAGADTGILRNELPRKRGPTVAFVWHDETRP